ncbi:UNKNOWN [Stylonychia lemnae]|uniref:Uncharacterized protein n=1 Tax=Stylonychia lemnae TaxID=5949 RepID=A0A078AGL6_STYLE|nr:UNKNOWN [Stylonychia lemnae]|eukprot:CDW81420.1 UNKNOWN [Stylonychia lemnae]
MDLIIKAIPLDDNSDPDIYISKTVRFPNSSLDSEWQCSSYGRDTCTIHHDDIKPDDVFYIGITSPHGECHLSLFTMTSDEFKLDDGIYNSF